MNSELKIYKIDLKEASKEIQYLIQSFMFSNLKITQLKTEIWENYLIVTISLQDRELDRLGIELKAELEKVINEKGYTEEDYHEMLNSKS